MPTEKALVEMLANQRSTPQVQQLKNEKEYLVSVNPHLAELSPQRASHERTQPINEEVPPSNDDAPPADENGQPQPMEPFPVVVYDPLHVSPHRRLRISETLTLALRVLQKGEEQGAELSPEDIQILKEISSFASRLKAAPQKEDNSTSATVEGQDGLVPL